MGIKELAMDMGGLKTVYKRVIYLAVLFVLVVAGAWLIKFGVDSNFSSRVGQFLSDMNIFKAGITIHVPDDKIASEDLGKSTSNSLNNQTSGQEDASKTVKSASNSTISTVKLTTRAQKINAMVAHAKAADNEVKKLTKLEEISKTMETIASSVNDSEVSGNEAELTSIEGNIAQIQAQIDTLNQQILTNIGNNLSQIGQIASSI